MGVDTVPWRRGLKAATRSLVSHAEQLELLHSRAVRQTCQPLTCAGSCCLPSLLFVIYLPRAAEGERLCGNDIQPQQCLEQGTAANTSRRLPEAATKAPKHCSRLQTPLVMTSRPQDAPRHPDLSLLLSPRVQQRLFPDTQPDI